MNVMDHNKDNKMIQSLTSKLLEDLNKPLAFLQTQSCAKAETNSASSLDYKKLKLLFVNNAFNEFIYDYSLIVGHEINEGILMSDQFTDAYKRLLNSDISHESIQNIDIQNKIYRFSLSKTSHDNIINIGIFGEDTTAEVNEKILHEKILNTRNEFMGHISHEIRTPLNGINAIIEILNAMKDLPIEVRRYLIKLNSCSISLLTIINDILDYSRLEAKKLELVHKPFSITQCISSAIMLIEQMAKEKKLQLLTNITSDVPAEVIGDTSRIKQILTNLIGNAIKFTQKGYVRIDVEKEYEEYVSMEMYTKIAKSYENYLSATDKIKLVTLKFSIVDTGIGIPREKISQLFKPFTQIDSGLRKKYDGVGLGLSICKNLIDLMNGKIYVDSVENRGSTFSFTIQLPTVSKDTKISDINYKELVGKKVLVVDDNKMSLDYVSQLLIRAKMWPCKCSSASEALVYFDSHFEFDLILLDVYMPDIDGCALSQMVRDYGYGCPIIGLSSINVENIPKNHKFNYIIVKPFNEIELFSAIINCCETKMMSASLMRSADRYDRDHDIDQDGEVKKIRRHSGDYFEHFIRRNKGKDSYLNSAPIVPKTKSHVGSIIDERLEHSSKILIVEDRQINIDVTYEQLKSLGYKYISHVTNGDAAIEAIKNDHFDIILMDISMPNMDGIECTEKIMQTYKEHKSRHYYGMPHIIGLTANTSQDILSLAEKVGMKPILLKPVSMNDLRSALHQYL